MNTYTRRQAAEALGVSVRTVDRYLKGGRLTWSRNEVSGRIEIRRSSVEKLNKSGTTRPGTGRSASPAKTP